MCYNLPTTQPRTIGIGAVMPFRLPPFILLAACLVAAPAYAGTYDFGAETLVQGHDGPVQTLGYSVPSLADWNDDGLPDLVVGEGSGALPGRVRVHLNTGAPGAPAFTQPPLTATTTEGELVYAGSG